MYNRILVPTDGSSEMARVYDHAATFADEHDAEIHVLYVVNTASFANMPMETSWEGVTGMLRDEGETALAAARDGLDDRPMETAISEGQPSREIVSYAETEGCDLILMGTHGRGGLNRLLLGSVAERVVRTSPVPVLTVRVGSVDVTELERGDSGVDTVTADPRNAEALE